MALQDNDKPGHCCLCGDRNRRSLCTRCFRKWSVGGALPDWLRSLANQAQQTTKRYNRNLQRLNQPVTTKPGSVGKPRYAGFRLVSLESLQAAESL